MNGEYTPRDPSDAPVNLAHCRKSVRKAAGWHYYRSVQCSRKWVVDKKWCRQHDPKAIAARMYAARERVAWKRAMQKEHGTGTGPLD